MPRPSRTRRLLSGAGFSTAGRRHNRTSSSTSARSLMATMGSANASTTSIPMRSAPGASLSRQNSSASHPSLAGTSPAAADLIAGPGYFPSSQRVPPPVATSAGTLATPAGQEQQQQQPLSPSHVPGTVRYEETLLHREQLETALQENEALRRRIRELERLVRERRRSESVSTTGGTTSAGPGASANAAPQRPGGDRERSLTAASMGAQSIAGSVGVGVPEEEVKVGESASNAGLAQGV
ncbi:hypothetical protein BN1723_004137 [Verticillium longisporum]|uniref:Uncharacterized protein n=1 Tax=Verticillium longisporum TaxID=100787 RepID=A0A0G4MMV3_VERLO|nr:hypothetical protein BN1723_004137 [Verticillium longisporum]